MTDAITFSAIERLTGFQLGIFDVACPDCGPGRREPRNRRREVLRIWRKEPDFATYCCNRCGVEGWARSGRASSSKTQAPRERSVGELARPIDDGEEYAKKQLAKAGALWRRSLPWTSTYLRAARSYNGVIPATLRFLPATDRYPPAMMAPFGMCDEPEPNMLAIADAAVRGVHLTSLKEDGSGKADVQPNKIMVGRSNGWPIVLAPPNDLLGLVIAEGIESALSLHEATGLGAWAAGSAGRMPALADKVPDYIDCVTVAAEDDDAGREGADELVGLLIERGLHVEMCQLGAKGLAT